MEQPAAMRRLRRVHAATAPDAGAMGGSASEVEPPKAGPEPEPRGAPKLLTDEQMKSYVMNVREHVCVAFSSSLVVCGSHKRGTGLHRAARGGHAAGVARRAVADLSRLAVPGRAGPRGPR